MANKTGWSGGRLYTGLGWTALFGAEIATMANLNAVLSSVVITNGTGLDQLMDVSMVGTIASSAVVQGSGVTLWLAMLAADGSTYGDGKVSGSAGGAAILPPWPCWTFLPVQAATTTSLIVTIPFLAVPPGSCKLIAQNQIGFAFSSMQIYGRSYNQDLNAN
jgi:hypothetical protein